MQIERIYSQIRQEALADQTRRIEEAGARIPALAALDAKRRDVLRSVGSRAISPAAASDTLSEISACEQRLLSEAGFPPDQLQLRYRCPDCRDTGWIGRSQRRPCACRLLLTAKYDPSVGINDTETFERFREDVFRDAEQKKRTVNARKWCMTYADALPAPEKPNVLLMGQAGLGKTFLSNAIAFRALSRGVEAQQVTAYGFVQDALSAVRTRGMQNARFFSVPLLVLDDLGTEPLIPNVSEEALFSLLNERLCRRLPTVTATNLTVSALQDRYGERVLSRLTDRAATQMILLTGENLRWSPTC